MRCGGRNRWRFSPCVLLLAACRRSGASRAAVQRYLTNDEAADYLRLSPRYAGLQRVLGGGPKFLQVRPATWMYAVADLDAWAAERSFETTSDPEIRRAAPADSRAR